MYDIYMYQSGWHANLFARSKPTPHKVGFLKKLSVHWGYHMKSLFWEFLSRILKTVQSWSNLNGELVFWEIVSCWRQWRQRTQAVSWALAVNIQNKYQELKREGEQERGDEQDAMRVGGGLREYMYVCIYTHT